MDKHEELIWCKNRLDELERVLREIMFVMEQLHKRIAFLKGQ